MDDGSNSLTYLTHVKYRRIEGKEQRGVSVCCLEDIINKKLKSEFM